MISISLSPNMQADDIAIVWRTLLTPWRWPGYRKIIPAIENQLKERLDKKHAHLTSSGRTALYQALRGHDIAEGDEVIVQAFTCLAVSNAVTWTGATPIYVDVNESDYNINPALLAGKITPNTKAVIVQHTFGIPADMAAIVAIARQHQIPVIEDLAHSLGGSYNNQPLGTHTDTTILSFGRDKTISCVYGGALLTNDSNVAEISQSLNKELTTPPIWWSKQQLFHPLAMKVIIPTYFTLSIGKVLLVALQKLRFLSKAVSVIERSGHQPNFMKWRFSPLLAPLLLNQVKKIDQYTTHRRRLATRYQNRVKPSLVSVSASNGLPPASPAVGSSRKGERRRDSEPSLSISTSNNHSPSWLRVPIQVADNKSFLKQARDNHLLLGDWYTLPVMPGSDHNTAITKYQAGSCPVAEKLAKSCINLPTHPNISDSDADSIITYINQYA